MFSSQKLKKKNLSLTLDASPKEILFKIFFSRLADIFKLSLICLYGTLYFALTEE
jgi:hypothetical protein